MDELVEKTPRRIPYNLRLRSLKSSRQSLTRIIRSWASGEISAENARMATWLLQVLLQYHKESELSEVSERLTKLEKSLAEIEQRRPYEKRALKVAR